MGEIPDYGELISLDDFIEGFKVGLYISFDGSGDLATETQVSNITAPTNLNNLINIQKYTRFTHVVWYNK